MNADKRPTVSPKQERSQQTRARIAGAALDVLARHGIAGLTHRRLAEAADVPLAATTYYFESKHEIVADASRTILDGYVSAFQRVLELREESQTVSGEFTEIAIRLIRNATKRDRTGAMGWAEIILDSARHEDSRILARDWFSKMDDLWLGLAQVYEMKNAARVSRSAIDVIIGLLLMAIALGLTERQVERVLSGATDAIDLWPPRQTPTAGPASTARATPKALASRQRILTAAINTLIDDGPEGVTFRAVASKAAMTPAAPLYHFPTIDSLLTAAQSALFDASKARYRAAMSGVDYAALTTDQLIDVTTTVFLREATEHGGSNIAHYSIWLQAGRQPDLRPMIWASIEDQILAWRRMFANLAPDQRPIDALFAQALFIGKIIRILATGSQMSDLVRIRAEFAADLADMIQGEFWWKTGTVDQKT